MARPLPTAWRAATIGRLRNAFTPAEFARYLAQLAPA